jgi:hypothetical protein
MSDYRTDALGGSPCTTDLPSISAATGRDMSMQNDEFERYYWSFGTHWPKADVISLEIPQGTDMRINSQMVDCVLVQFRWESGQRPTLEFAGAVLSVMPAIGTKDS